MIRKYKRHLIITSVIILLPIVAGLLIRDYLPEQIAIHWNAHSEPDKWSNRDFTIWGLPLMMFVLHWVCVFFTAHDPKNKDQSNRAFNMILWFLPIASLTVCGFTYAFALGKDVSIDMTIRVLLGIFFVVIGNYMPKYKQNYTIGVKVAWTLHNEENWNKTHRFAGKVWVLGGFLLLASLLVPMENTIYIVLPVTLFIAFAPIIYSYVYYRKQLKAGTAA